MASFDEFTREYLNKKKRNSADMSSGVKKTTNNTFDDFTQNYLAQKSSRSDYGVTQYNELVSAYQQASKNASKDSDTWHEKSYYSNQSQYLSDLEERKKGLENYFKNNSQKYSADFLAEMNANLKKLSDTSASLKENNSSAGNFYSKWETKEDFNRDYDNYTYSNKYKGKTYADLTNAKESTKQKVLEATGDELDTLNRELHWLESHSTDKQFADTMTNDELIKYKAEYENKAKALKDTIENLNAEKFAYERGGQTNNTRYKTIVDKLESAQNELSTLENNNGGVLYYDDNGSAVTAQQLLEIKSAESDLAKINSNESSKVIYDNIVALEQQYKDISSILTSLSKQGTAEPNNRAITPEEQASLQLIANKYNISANGTAGEIFEKLYSSQLQIQNQLNTNIEDLNAMGYNYDNLHNYNDWKSSKDAYAEKIAEYQNYAIEHPILATGKSIIEAPLTIAEFGGNIINSLGNESALINVYDDEYTNKGQVYQDTVANLIEDAVNKKTNSEVASWLASTAYSGITSAAQSALIGTTFSLAFGPKVGEVIALGVMGTQAAANSYNSAIKNGSTNGEAVTYAVASGIGEALFEKVPLDNLFRLGKSATKETLSSVIKTIVKQSAIEGLEEGGTELWNTIADGIINGDRSAYNTSVRQYELQGYSAAEAEKLATTEWLNELLTSVVGGVFGGLSTGSVAGVGYVPGAIKRNQEKSQEIINTGTSIANAFDVTNLISDAKSIDNLSKSDKRRINKLTNKLEGINIENGFSSKYAKNVGKLFNLVSEKQKNNVRTAITEELKSNNADSSAETVDVVLKYAQGDKLTEKEQTIFDENKGAYVLDEVEHKLLQKSIKPTVETVSGVNADTFEGTTENTVKNDFKQTTYNGEAISFKYKSPETVELDNGETVSVEDITMSDDDVVFYDAIMGENDFFPEARFVNGKLASGVNISTANEIRKIFGGTPTINQLKGIKMYYHYGMYNIRSFGESGALTEAQERQVFNLGRALAESVAEKESGTPKVKKYSKGKVKYNVKSELTTRQQASVEVIEKLADMFNITFNLYESTLNENGERLSVMPNGEKTSANGYYMNGEIYVDINAGNNGQGAMLYTVAHELTHYIREWSPKKFKALADFLVEQYEGKGHSVEFYVNKQMEKARKSGNKNMKYSEAFEEFVADSMEKMLTDKNAVEKLVALRTKDKSIFDKLREGIMKLVDRIKQEYAKLAPDSAEGRIVEKMTDVFSDIQDLFLEALDDASNNFQKEEKNTATNDGVKMKVRDDFAQQLQDWQNGYGKPNGKYNGKYFDLGTTSNVLVKHGAPNANLIMYEDCLLKITGGKHSIALDELAKLPYELDDPVLLFKGSRYNSFVALTEMFDKQGNDIIVAIHINKKYGRNVINKIASIYSKSDDFGNNKINNYISQQIEKGNLIDASKNKASMWFTSRGLQLPKLVQTIIDANNSVPQENTTVNNNSMQEDKNNTQKKFSLRENVEVTKDLVAVHNLSAEKLLKSLNLGGLPMPSIAIMKAKDGHNQFGDISLVFRKGTIDPEADKANKVYSGDAWTPTYPRTEYKVNEDVAGKIYHRARVAGETTFFRPVHFHPDNIVDEVNSFGGIEGLINHYKDDHSMKQFYLAETSEPVKMIMGEKRNELSKQEIEQFDFVINALGKDNILKLNTEGYSGRNWMEEFGEEYKTALVKYYRTTAKASVTDEEIREIVESQKAYEHASNVKRIKKYIESGSIEVTPVQDYKATQKEIDNRVNQDEYIAWLTELFDGLVEKSGIRNNVDPYTSTGDKKSFEATHYVENLENVVKAMKEQQDVGNSFLFSGFGIWGVASKRFNSVDEIKADSNRLVEYNEELFSEVKRSIGSKLTDIADTILNPRESNYFIARDNAIDCILETIATAKTRSGMLKQLKSYYALNQEMVTESLVQDIIDLVAEVQSMPTDYFEAKPQRAVHFNEVAGVILPSQESYEEDLTEIKAKLSEYGIPIVEYTFGSNDERIQALNSLEDVKFSERGEVQIDYEEITKSFNITKPNDYIHVQRQVFDTLKNEGFFTSEDKSSRIDYNEDSGMVIETNKSGIKETFNFANYSSLGRTKKALKLATIRKLPEIIKNGKLIDNNVNNYHSDNSSTKFAYIQSVIDVNGNDVSVQIDIKKSPQKNKFWVHRIDILEKANELPAVASRAIKQAIDSLAYDDSVPNSNENVNDNSIKFSERGQSVYKLLGENQRLQKENEVLSETVEYLEKLVQMQGPISAQIIINEESVKNIAKDLKKNTSSKIKLSNLEKQLVSFYSYILSSNKHEWNDILSRAALIATDILNEVPESNQRDDYAQEILSYLRSTNITLNNIQREEVENIYDSYNAYRKRLMGSITISQKGTSLDSVWQDLAEQYPDTFSKDTNPADMPLELADIIHTLRNSYEVIKEFDKTEQVRNLAERIYNTYWDLSLAETAINQLPLEYRLKVKELRNQHANLMKEIVDTYEDKLAFQREKYKYLRERATVSHKMQMLKYKEDVQNAKLRAIEKRNNTETRRQILKTLDKVEAKLFHPTKEKNIGLEMQPLACRLLMLANLDTVDADYRIERLNLEMENTRNPQMLNTLNTRIENIQKQGEKKAAELQRKQNRYKAIVSEAEKALQEMGQTVEIDEVVIKTLEDIEKLVGSKPIRRMTSYELECLKGAVNMVDGYIRTDKQLFIDGKKQDVENMAQTAIREILGNSKKEKQFIKQLEWLNKGGWSMLKPETAFDLIGSSALSNLFQEARKGDDKFARSVSSAQLFLSENVKKYGADKWDMEERHEFNIQGEKVTLTLGEILSLYAYSKREQAIPHLESGGFVQVEPVKKKIGGKINIEFTVYEDHAHRISEIELGSIINALTKEQVEFADVMQEYLSTVMGAKGNEISRELYQIDLFKEKFYFPLKLSSVYKFFKKNENTKTPVLKNIGMTKPTVVNANDPIVLESFENVWANHVVQMSRYNAYVLGIENLTKVFGYTGVDKSSVRAALQGAYGDAAIKYIENFIIDLNGGRKGMAHNDMVNVASKLVSTFKKVTVSASLSTAIQQPSSVIRAMSYVKPKYFVMKKTEKISHKDNWNELKKYAPIVILKEIGGYDMSSGVNVAEFIKQRDYKGKDKFKALIKDSNYRDELLMWGASKADEMAWSFLWNAIKKEQRNRFPNMEKEKFLKICGQRFTDVATKTQVYDSVFTRSEIMRSPSETNKMATSFMGEPMTNLNILIDSIIQAKRGKITRKQAAWNICCVYIAQIAASALASIVYAMRDDDDDESFYEKYMMAFGNKVKDEILPITWVPYIRDVFSLIEGYDVTRVDMSVFADLVESFKNLDSKSKSTWDKVSGVVGSFAAIFGLPLKNLMRDGKAIISTIQMLFDDNVPQSGDGVKALAEGVFGEKKMADVNEYLEKGKTDKANKLINDLLEEKTEKYISNGKTPEKAEKDAKSSIRSSLTSYWKPLFIEAYQEDDYIEQEEIYARLNSTGIYGTPEELAETIEKWVKELQ